MSNRRCAAKTCFNSQKSRPNLKFFTFPKDEALCRQWVVNCGRDDLLEKTAEQLSKFLLCAEHFEPHWFLNKYRTAFIRSGQPVPTIFYNNLAEFVPKSVRKLCQLRTETSHVPAVDGITSSNKERIQAHLPEESSADSFLREKSDLSFIGGNEQSTKEHCGDTPPEVRARMSESLERRGCYKMCRLCACLVYEDKLMSLFGEQSDNQNVMAMISKFLPDKVHKNDGLPHHVCCSCVFKLSKCHQTVEAFLAADKKLRVLFESQSKSTQNLTYIKLEENQQNPSKSLLSDQVGLPPDLSEFLTVKKTTTGKQSPASVNECSDIAEKNDVIYVFTDSGNQSDANVGNDSCDSSITSSHQTSLFSGCETSKSEPNISDYKAAGSFGLKSYSKITQKEETSNTENDRFDGSFFSVECDSERPHKCTICKQRFETSDKLFIHEFTKHSIEKLPDNKNVRRYRKRELHKCEDCGLVFCGLKPYRKHVKEHHIPAENICEFCGAHYKIKSQLEIHRRLHTNEKPYTCTICQESFHFKKALRRHKRTHIEPKSLTCSICNKTFANRSAMWRHEKIHSDSRNVLCYLCGKVLSNPQSLRVHMRTHSSDRPCSCPTCGKSFKDNVSVNKHLIIHSTEKNFHCDICGRAFYSKALVKQHKLSHSGVKPHTCETCGAAFNRLGNLNQHKKKHLYDFGNVQDVSYECVICSKKLKSELTLKYHLAKHTGEKKPFDCEVCGKRFIAVDPYRVHMRIHTGERPYECDVCGKTFRSSFTLKQHSALHKDEYPYPCPFCERRFKRLQSLVVHKRTHTGEKPHQCPICSRAFAQKGDMQKHTKTHTKDKERIKQVRLDDDAVVMEIEQITELALSDTEITSEFLIDMPIVEVETEIQQNEIHVQIQPDVESDVTKSVASHLQADIREHIATDIQSVIHSEIQSAIHPDIHSVIHSNL
ncbi:zinc finger protein 540-like isoform X2 [Schistocerca gregaria]|uniref:zinc finger protein 540-like isoform X2 n=1 Tax=Schistocerca gregaria TaxID=7010 RepID=UPI00211E2A3B|nr:zinc finger protein 540-like isoform X2 [Schistocerca gregaria]